MTKAQFLGPGTVGPGSREPWGVSGGYLGHCFCLGNLVSWGTLFPGDLASAWGGAPEWRETGYQIPRHGLSSTTPAH